MIANGTSGGQLQKEEPYLDQQTEVDQITKTELTVDNRKVDANQIVVLLVAGTTLISASMHEEQWPEEFFGVWVRSNRRKWIEAAKSEMKGWFDNDAIEIVLFMNNTKNECKASDLTIAQIADIGTKVLHEAAFVRLRNMTNESASIGAEFLELQLLQYVCDDIIDDVVKNHT